MNKTSSTSKPAPPQQMSSDPNQNLETLLDMDNPTNRHAPPDHQQTVVDHRGRGLEFDNLSYSVLKKQKKGRVVTAIMGPSGAGKSTFLDALTGRIARGSLEGSVRVDSIPVTTSYIKNVSSYVMQDDQLFPMLTVFETFMFAAEVRLPPSVSRAEKRRRVHDLLDQLGLQTAAHTYIGDEGRRGVSGGERRRVSIGIDIIHGPSLLFLDEPTSGLDSTSAYNVVEKVKDIARGRSIVLMTIHQPSFRIQMLLDRIVILARIRKEVPEGENSLEYLLDVIKEYDESTLGLEPLVVYQRDGVKPNLAARTPIPKTPRTPYQKSSSKHIPLRSLQFSSGNMTPRTDLSRFDQAACTTRAWLRSSARTSPCGSTTASRAPPTTTTARPGLPLGLPDGPPPRPQSPQPTRARTIIISSRRRRRSTSASARTRRFARRHRVATSATSVWGRSSRTIGRARWRCLSWRTALNVVRTPELFLSREIVLTVMAVILSTLFRRLDQLEFQTINRLLNFYIFSVCLVFFSSNDAVPTFIQERFFFIRETSHNAYRASSYVVSSLLVYLPFFSAMQGLTFAIITRYMLHLKSSLFYFWVILFASLTTTNGYVMLVSALIPFYWRWLHYISAIKYPFEGLLLNEFKGSRCYHGSSADLSSSPLGEHKNSSLHFGQYAREHPLECMLVGEDVVETMDIQLKSIWADVAILLAWGVVYRLLFYVVLRFYSKNERK
ncbi:ABC transporter G family member 2 [Acorus calamus]|uniref:ABC transporter G family member 2 n=1 Tax=Acorus calamus TaxID=4465 RepID=A0AAV9E248_ACOCL|nr:ABC transporter G family member 2 [Acorus calamus]